MPPRAAPARPFLSEPAARELKPGTAVEVEWRDGRSGLYEANIDERGVLWVASEESRGRRSEHRLWLPVNLFGGDKVRLAG